MRIKQAAVCVFLCAGSTLAGPLVSQRILPDATWVLHVNVEAVTESNIGRAMLDGEIGAEIRADLANDGMQELGIDPLRDVKGITLFGHGEDDSHAVVIVSGTPAIDGALARLPEIAEGYTEIREGDRVVHSWRDGDETNYIYACPGSGPGERLVLFSENIDELRRGMVRLEVGGADVAPALQQQTPAAGSFIFFSAEEFPGMLDHAEEASAIFRYARGMTLDAGESGNEFRADARLRTETPAEATTMLQVVQGMMALGRMAAAGEPDLQPLLRIADGCRASTDGAALALSFRIDSGVLAEIAREFEAMEQDRHHDADGDEDERELRREMKQLEKLRDVKPSKQRKQAD